MNSNLDRVLKAKEEQMARKKAEEELNRQQKMLGKLSAQEVQERD